MSEEREKGRLADLSSILTLPGLAIIGAGLAYWFHLEIANQMKDLQAHSDAGLAAIRQESALQYETKAGHDADIAEIRANGDKLWQATKDLTTGENDIRLNVQHLTDMTDERAGK